MEAAANTEKCLLRYISFNELMYETLNKHEICLWEKVVHCQNLSCMPHSQISLLKGIIKEKKKIIKLFTKLLEFAQDVNEPCDNCITCQKNIDAAIERVKTVAQNQPTECDYKLEYEQFQEELRKHCKLQASTCNLSGNPKSGLLLDLSTEVMDATATATATTTTMTMADNDIQVDKLDAAVEMPLETFEAIPKSEQLMS